MPGSINMPKHDNTIRHDPKNGQWGDCHRVCYAMIFNLLPEEVPHFFDGGDVARGWELQEEFLRRRGLAPGHILFDPDVVDLDGVLAYLKNMAPDIPVILGGRSRNGVDHSVVSVGGEIFHDPTGAGIIAPCKGGYYWATFFSPRVTL